MSRFILLHNRAGDEVVVPVNRIIVAEVAEDGTSAILIEGLEPTLFVTEEVVEIYERLDCIRSV